MLANCRKACWSCDTAREHTLLFRLGCFCRLHLHAEGQKPQKFSLLGLKTGYFRFASVDTSALLLHASVSRSIQHDSQCPNDPRWDLDGPWFLFDSHACALHDWEARALPLDPSMFVQREIRTWPEHFFFDIFRDLFRRKKLVELSELGCARRVHPQLRLDVHKLPVLVQPLSRDVRGTDGRLRRQMGAPRPCAGARSGARFRTSPPPDLAHFLPLLSDEIFSSRTAENIVREVACYDDEVLMECPLQRFIQVYDAFYGRISESVCPPPNPDRVNERYRPCPSTGKSRMDIEIISVRWDICWDSWE